MVVLWLAINSTKSGHFSINCADASGEAAIEVLELISAEVDSEAAEGATATATRGCSWAIIFSGGVFGATGFVVLTSLA